MKIRYRPMMAQSARGPFSSSDWVFEVKWDGIRAIAYINDEVSIQSRNNQELAGKFPELDELRALAPHTVLDGEIVVMKGGRIEMQPLLSRLQVGAVPFGQEGQIMPVTYIVFDILEKDGLPIISLPLFQRQKILKERVAESPHVILSVPVDERGSEYYRAAVAAGLEGIIAKRRDSIYLPGRRSDAWLKIKVRNTCDGVIAGYSKGLGRRSADFGSLILGLYEHGREETPLPGQPGISPGASFPGPRLVYIGKVGSGFSDGDRASLMQAFEDLKINLPQLAGVDDGKEMTWLRPALVCEVAYQEVTKHNRLRIPRFLRIRSDKRPEDCTIDQLVPVTIVPEILGKDSINPRSRRDVVAEPARKEQTPPGNQSGRGSGLEEYREKRDISVTGEPEGSILMNTPGNAFVVQEHHAHHLHYDLRLERDGVLKSWAVPKGIPQEPGVKHLAVMVEDHPLDYKDFEGTIPKGEYGAGTVSTWDQGTYETMFWDEHKIEVILFGKRLSGHYVLVAFKRAKEHEWLIFKARKKNFSGQGNRRIKT